MVTFVALLSSAVWGTADFVGGLWAKRFHPVKVVALSQLGGLVAALIFVGGFYVLYLGGIFGAVLDSHGAHLLMNLHFVLSGYLFYWTVIGVDPSAQGLGLGKVLLLQGLAWLHDRGCPEVLLYVDGTNTGARRLYEHYGFREHDLDVQWRSA